MKNIFILLFLSFNTYSQQKNYFTCDEIKKTIIDGSLFDTLSNGKLISRLDLKKNQIFKIYIDDKSFYYVSKSVMKKIKKSKRMNKCKNIKISKIESIKQSNVKIIRD